MDGSHTFNAMQTSLNAASPFAKPRMLNCPKPRTALIRPSGGSTIDLRLRICVPAFLAVQRVMRGCRARILSGIDSRRLLALPSQRHDQFGATGIQLFECDFVIAYPSPACCRKTFCRADA